MLPADVVAEQRRDFSVSESSLARSRQLRMSIDQAGDVEARPIDAVCRRPCIIVLGEALDAIGVQIARAGRCIGIETSSTVAPSSAQTLRRRAHLRVDVRLGIGLPEAFLDDADAQALDAAAERLACSLRPRTLYCRGSKPSAPAITSSSSALSATFAVIGPV